MYYSVINTMPYIHRCGSMDPQVAQLLALHCQPLLPSGSAELDVTHSVQVAALAGTGLLYMGSSQRHLVEVMLKEIGMSYVESFNFWIISSETFTFYNRFILVHLARISTRSRTRVCSRQRIIFSCSWLVTWHDNAWLW